MRVLRDENLPLDFAAEIRGHVVVMVRGQGGAGLQNGALMRRAASACDVFITMDKNIPHQQHIPALPFGVILLSAPSNRLLHLRVLVDRLLQVIPDTRPGELRRVGG